MQDIVAKLVPGITEGISCSNIHNKCYKTSLVWSRKKNVQRQNTQGDRLPQLVVASLCKHLSLQQVEQNQIRLNLCDFLWQENSVVVSILERDLSL